MSSIEITIDFSDINPDLEIEEFDELTRRLRDEIKEVVDDVSLVRESEIPKQSKSALAGFVLGVLKAEVSLENIAALFNFLSSRFKGKPIEMIVKAPDGREISLKAGNREDFEYGMLKAQEFLSQSQRP